VKGLTTAEKEIDQPLYGDEPGTASYDVRPRFMLRSFPKRPLGPALSGAVLFCRHYPAHKDAWLQNVIAKGRPLR
jgi:hypothetical protein